MIRFRTWLCAASAACGLILGSGAQAQVTSIILPSGGCVVNGSTLDCSGGGVVTPPSGTCSLSASTTTQTINQNVVLTVTCSGTSGTVLYGFTARNGANQSVGNPCNESIGKNCTFTLTSPDTYTVTATAADSTGNLQVSPSSKSITFQDVASGGGGGTIPTTCDNGKASVVAKTSNVFNGAPLSVAITDSQVAVFPIVAPAAGKAAQLVFFETGDPFSDKVPRNMWASKTPCYTPAASRRFAFPGPSAQVAYQVGGGGTINMSTVGGSLVSFPSGFPMINAAPGETWYVMVENAVAGQCKQANSKGACNISLTPNPAN
ncbi:MAG TPA: hypothetical protein VN789_13300 [Casimicrobiaceae bacterium]|jgi:hypothetical protein|nr:hypothetical protein [Casimicrobiaceae bacterium]